MVIVLSGEQESLLRQMAADVDETPESLLVLLVSDRLAHETLGLFRS
jgi:hypothetical protein